jgi:hypothetical protein
LRRPLNSAPLVLEPSWRTTFAKRALVRPPKILVAATLAASAGGNSFPKSLAALVTMTALPRKRRRYRDPASTSIRPLDCIIGKGYGLDLEKSFRRIEGRHLDDGVCWVRRLEVATTQVHDLREVLHVAQEDRDLDDIRHARAASLENSLEILEDLCRLLVEISAYDLTVFVDRGLPGNEEKVPGPKSL